MTKPKQENEDRCWEQKESLLLQKVAEGDWDAYTQLFTYYLPRLTRYIFPFAGQSMHDTEECIQEVFLRIWEKRQTLVGIQSFDHYLFRMAKNKLINNLRKEKSYKELHLQYSRSAEKKHVEPENALQYNEYQSTARKGIDQLSPKLRVVFMLSTQEDWSLDEISRELRLPKETVKKRLYMATTFIRTYLRQHAEWSFVVLGCYLLF